MTKTDLLQLVRAAYDKWELHDRKEGTPATFCNMFVRDVPEAKGYTKCKGMRANDMHRHMVYESNKEAGDFTRIPPMGLAEVLNDEHEAPIIIASKPNMDGPGHVCILLPGEFQFSGKWQKNVPLCANIGGTNFWNKGASYAFKVEPEYFRCRGV
jgi:hypothetical protein